MKKLKKVVCSVVVATLVVGSLSACAAKIDKDYFDTVTAYSFWDNKGEQSIAQYKFYNIMNDFLFDGTIVDGNVIGANGKVKKVAFLGVDGTRADALTNVLHDTTKFETNSYHADAPFSAINTLKKEGGLYLAYSGGEKGKDSEQSSSTSASWTSQLTGAWHTEHGVKENEDVKNMEKKTIMLTYAEKGLQTSLAFDWGQYFDINLREEVRYLMKHPELNLTYCDIDRAVATDAAAVEKVEPLIAANVEEYNFVASKTPSKDKLYDIGMRDYLMARMEAGDDILGGIFHNVDSNGHTDGFSNSNASYVNSVRTNDNYCYQLIEAIKEREATKNEEWLILMTVDHGGRGRGHGDPTYEERTTWIATNRKIDTKYYATNYNGFHE